MLKTSTALVLGTTLLCFSLWMSRVAASEYRPQLKPSHGFGAQVV